ncbi:sulfite exporter TauE/SafE family protein [Oscillospiraceae bacterium CM]|nr:sulfite exporter TauE/SafE family protein [Oscillospiraceae bacterium CM]
MAFLFDVLAGLATGVLSAWGIGGGSLLIIYMTVLARLPQQAAQGVNLLYFLPTSVTALISHIRNGLVEKVLAYPAVLAGVTTALGGSFAASVLSAATMRKIFGVFIILVGLSEVLRVVRKKKNGR